jgi:hypothetical protein
MTTEKEAMTKLSDVGDEGEDAVVEQLHRRGRTAKNPNNNPKRHHPIYDVYAEKDGRKLSIRVSARNYGGRNFQLSKTKVARSEFRPDDFTVLVSLNHSGHSYHVVPSRIVLAVAKERLAWREENARQKKKLDWPVPVNLYLHDSRHGEASGPGWGLGKTWARYLDNWNFET